MIAAALAGAFAVIVVVVPGPHPPAAPTGASTAAAHAAASTPVAGVELAGWKLTLPVAGDHGGATQPDHPRWSWV